MTPQCRASVNAAAAQLGRGPLTDAQVKAIDDRISATMRRLARDDPGAWAGLSRDQRMQQAAEAAMRDIQAEAARKVRNAELQVLKTIEVENRIGSQRQRMGWGRTKTLVDDMELSDKTAQAVRNEYTGRLMDTLEAAGSQEGAGLGRRALMFLFDAQNPQMTRDLALEVFAQGKGDTGNALATKGAQAWLKTIEAMRQRFNAAGGDVGALDYGYLPQPHDKGRMLQAGADRWAADLLPRLDRSRYLREDGSRMADSEVLDMLRRAWETITSDGLNKTEPGQFRSDGARANRGSQSREIHFKDGEAYLDYLADYGAGSMYDAMVSHIGRLAKDITLVERYGPNPSAQMRLQMDLAARADNGEKRVFGMRPESYWAALSGTAGTPNSPRLAQIGQHVRNIQTFGKLQGAVLSSITDLGTYFVTAGFNKLSYWDGLANIGRAFGGDTREFLNMHGLVAESMASDLNRWSGEHIRNNWSGRVANATMRLSLMNKWTDTLRHGFALTMMRGMTKNTRLAWSELEAFDRYLYERKGITEADWEVLQQAQPVTFRGMEMLTPEAIHAIPDQTFESLPGRPLTVDEFKASVERQLNDAVDNAAKLRGELPAVESSINARLDLTPDEKKALVTRERARVAAADADVTRQIGAVQDRIDGYTKKRGDLMKQFANSTRNQVATKFLMHITDESQMGALNPDLAARVMGTAGGTQAGTIRGEAARAMMQFKSFPIAMISRHFRRMLETPQGLEGAPMLANRLAYAGAMMVSLTALGAIAFQTKQIVAGKDPVDMTTAKFWGRAAAQGGALGFYGDLLLADSTEDRSTNDPIFRLLGPTADSVAQIAELTKGNFDEWKAGKDTHIGAEALKFARGHLPLVNLWYLKAAIDHAGLHAIQENLSPGYLARMRGKAQKDWGQDYYWQPGDGLPDRAPSFADIAGQ